MSAVELQCSGEMRMAPSNQTLLDIGYNGYITVAQERDPRNADSSLLDATASRNFLQSAGFH